MPKYVAKRKTWLSHECRMVNEGEVFTADFPKIKGKDGSETEMKLSDNLELVADEAADDAPGKKGKKAADLV